MQAEADIAANSSAKWPKPFCFRTACAAHRLRPAKADPENSRRAIAASMRSAERFPTSAHRARCAERPWRRFSLPRRCGFRDPPPAASATPPPAAAECARPAQRSQARTEAGQPIGALGVPVASAPSPVPAAQAPDPRARQTREPASSPHAYRERGRRRQAGRWRESLARQINGQSRLQSGQQYEPTYNNPTRDRWPLQSESDGVSRASTKDPCSCARPRRDDLIARAKSGDTIPAMTQSSADHCPQLCLGQKAAERAPGLSAGETGCDRGCSR